MTHVINFSDVSLDSNNKSLNFYTVEVVTFDNESVFVQVEARNEEEAQNMAASEVDNADYTMVQSCVAGW